MRGAGAASACTALQWNDANPRVNAKTPARPHGVATILIA
jgi:hypothetical protein